jgi:hypothetical protein
MKPKSPAITAPPMKPTQMGSPRPGAPVVPVAPGAPVMMPNV